MQLTSDDISTLTLQVCESILGLPIETDGPSVDSHEVPVSGTVWITGAWDGAVAIRCSRGLARTVSGAMFDTRPDDASSDEIDDAIGEIANMIGGNIKSLLPGPSKLSLPSVAHDELVADRQTQSGQSTTWNFVVNGEPFAVTMIVKSGPDGDDSSED